MIVEYYNFIKYLYLSTCFFYKKEVYSSSEEVCELDRKTINFDLMSPFLNTL